MYINNDEYIMYMGHDLFYELPSFCFADDQREQVLERSRLE